MSSDYKFVEKRQLEKVSGTVDIVTVRSGAVAIRLNNKRNQIFSLYHKAKVYDDSNVLHLEALNQAEIIAYEYDILRMTMAISAWDLPPEAFVIELPDTSLNRGNIELLREDVFGEINRIIAEYWEKPAILDKTEEEQEEETKNDLELSTNMSSAV